MDIQKEKAALRKEEKQADLIEAARQSGVGKAAELRCIRDLAEKCEQLECQITNVFRAVNNARNSCVRDIKVLTERVDALAK